MPTTPPAAAMRRMSASGMLRGESQTPRMPVCETTGGASVIASTSRTTAGEAWATSMMPPRSTIARTTSRPKSVSPPLSTPCSEPPSALSKKCCSPKTR